MFIGHCGARQYLIERRPTGTGAPYNAWHVISALMEPECPSPAVPPTAGIIEAAQHQHFIVQPSQWRQAGSHIIVSAGAAWNPITFRNPVAV